MQHDKDMGDYQKIRVDENFKTKLVTGSSFDRINGIEYFSDKVKNGSVLDIGCHRGLIAYEFARYGASCVHGFDVYMPGITFAEELFSEIYIDYVFKRVDLSLGVKHFVKCFDHLLKPSYDVVIFLAMYHHLKKQMPFEALKDLISFLLEKVGRYFVFRTPKDNEMLELIPDDKFKQVFTRNDSEFVACLHVFEKYNKINP